MEWLLIVAVFFAGVTVGWRTRGRWDRELQAFANRHGH